MIATSSDRRLRLITAISLGVNALLLLAAGAVVQRKGGVSFLRAKYYETFVQDPYDDPSRPFYESTAYRRETSIFDLVPIEPGDVVFLGDSHVQYGLWSELFGSSRVRNRGIAGDDAAGVLRRLDPIVAGRPSAVFLAVGSNDVSSSRGGTVEGTARSVMEIVDRLRRGSEATSVYVLSALPKSRNTEIHATESPRANRLNEALAAAAPAHGATYLDIATPLVEDDGSLGMEFTYDGGHLNGAGYRRVAEVLRPRVEAALASRAGGRVPAAAGVAPVETD
jgi:lysophospholipase L1-like esterase